MSFTVEPDAVGEFGTLLMYLSSDANSVDYFIKEHSDLGLHDEGILNRLFMGHAEVVSSMESRAHDMKSIAGSSSDELHYTAQKYRTTDKAHAEELDKTYPGGFKYEEPDSRKGGPPGKNTGFKHLEPGEKLKLGDVPTKAEMLGSDVELWARSGLDRLGILSGARALFEIFFQFDPIDWVREWYIGDWKAWGKCAQMWKACADTTEGIAENLWHGIDAVDLAWDGKAAEAAVNYFKKFRDGIYTEKAAYTGLQKRYEVLMEFIFEMHLIINDVLNTAVDIAIMILSLGSAGAVKESIKAAFKLSVSGGSLTTNLMDCVSYIGTVLSLISDVIKIFETIGDASDLPEVPASELDKLEMGDSAVPSYDYQQTWEKPADVEGP